MKKWLAQGLNFWALQILLLGLLLRGAIAAFLPPGFDEAYYYLYTQHLDWSYFDHPLLVALSTGLGVWLTGEVSQFTLRWGALLLHTGALWLLYLTGVRLFSPKAGLLTLAIASLIPIFMVGFGIMTLPDAPLIFFWSATLYVAAGEFFPIASPSIKKYQPTARIALLGLLVGLACLSKYHAVFLGLGLVGFCLTQPDYRRVFTSPWLVVGALLAVLAIAPILLWNTQHDWVSLRFQSGRAVPDRGYSLVDLLVTFLVGVAYLFPSFGFPLWWVTGRSLRGSLGLGKASDRKRETEDQRQATDINPAALMVAEPSSPSGSWFLQQQAGASAVALILWISLPLMLGFTLMGGYRSILPTWTAPGFWGATLLLGAWASQWPQRKTRRWLGISTLVLLPILLLALLHLCLGIFQKPSQYALFGGFLPPLTDASVQQMDIRQLRQGLGQPGLLTSGDFIFTNDIYLAGQVGMAIAGIPEAAISPQAITCFDPDPRGFAFWSAANTWVGQRGLWVTTQANAAQAIANYRPYFAAIQPLAEIPLRRGGVVVQTVQVYQAGALLKPYPRPYR